MVTCALTTTQNIGHVNSTFVICVCMEHEHACDAFRTLTCACWKFVHTKATKRMASTEQINPFDEKK